MKISKNLFFSKINNIVGNSCSVLQHTCNHGVINDDITNQILNKGIRIDNSWCIRRTCMPFGILPELDDNFKKRYFADYNMYSTNECINFVVAVPLFYTDSKGNTYFGGIIDCNKEDISNDDITTYIELEIQQRRIVPKEFILGYYKNDTYDDMIDFTFNPNFYEFLSQKEKDEFIRNFNIDSFFNLNGDIASQLKKADFDTDFFSSVNDNKKLRIYYSQILMIIEQCLYGQNIQININDLDKEKIQVLK